MMAMTGALCSAMSGDGVTEEGEAAASFRARSSAPTHAPFLPSTCAELLAFFYWLEAGGIPI